jgi:hypothetical protein
MERGPGFPDAIDPVRHLVSAFVRRENRARSNPCFRFEEYSQPGWFERFRYMGFPSAIAEKLDALLLVLGKRTPLDANPDVAVDSREFIPEVAPVNNIELARLLHLLEEQQLIVQVSPGRYRLTAPGLLRLDDLSRATSMTHSAFLAMWFADVTAPYRAAATAAIIHCGYEPLIVDSQEYNGFIMDRIVSDIRRSRFVIADFTAVPENNDPTKAKVQCGTRGGVYWEAGLAFGLGKQVIHTCRDDGDSKRRTHFDIEQYNTIFWSDVDLQPEIRRPLPSYAPRLAERLSARILSTLGRGSYVLGTQSGGRLAQ